MRAVCIKDFISTDNNNIKTKSGEIYTFGYIEDGSQDEIHYVLHLPDHKVWLSFSENEHERRAKFNNHFMLISEYREKRLKNLLDKDNEDNS